MYEFGKVVTCLLLLRTLDVLHWMGKQNHVITHCTTLGVTIVIVLTWREGVFDRFGLLGIDGKESFLFLAFVFF